MQMREIDPKRLNLFSYALKTLKNQFKMNEDGDFFVITSISRGLIGENIASGKPWFSNFHVLMRNRKLAKQISFERMGLNDMVQNGEFNSERDRKFIEAVHQALRRRYGMLSSHAKNKGEVPNFDREFERIRTSLMRAKNMQTMRSEVTNLFARGGINSKLQETWQEILPIVLCGDWQKTKDLSLLALASYSGEGAKYLASQLEEHESSQENEEEV